MNNFTKEEKTKQNNSHATFKNKILLVYYNIIKRKS